MTMYAYRTQPRRLGGDVYPGYGPWEIVSKWNYRYWLGKTLRREVDVSPWDWPDATFWQYATPLDAAKSALEDAHEGSTCRKISDEVEKT